MAETFRFATAKDVDAILSMMQEYYVEDGYPFDEGASRRAVAELVSNDHRGALWVAVDERDLVVGYLAVTLGFSLEYRGRDAFIDELFIAASSRGRGLGRRALELAESYCRERGVNALHLEVEPHRERALDLYRRAGFVDHERRLMTKSLG